MREFIEASEEQTLASYAAFSRGATRRYREAGEVEHLRSNYQLDRDRILYSTAFRRLQYKTQVYVVHEGDFYRTRLAHTLEVMQTARTLARALKCNEDLAEAIALAHDLGHPPFGHAGEEELRRLMRDAGGFDHNLQSLRIVDELERRYPDFPGLNLTYDTREGLARHTTDYDNPMVPQEFRTYPQPSLEAQIVSMADRLAYCTHDLDDALTGGLVSEEELRAERIPFVVESYEKACDEVFSSTDSSVRKDIRILSRRWVRHLIALLNREVIEQTRRNLMRSQVKTIEDVRRTPACLVTLPPDLEGQFNALNAFLLNRVYRSHVVEAMTFKGRLIIRRLFRAFLRNPHLLHPVTRARLEACRSVEDRKRVVCDHIAGMTDSFALHLYTAIFEPEGRAFPLQVPRLHGSRVHEARKDS
ncbi:MAG: deoxyguanosinetriphosphate triphosphohydrolase [Bacillota bacterium]